MPKKLRAAKETLTSVAKARKILAQRREDLLAEVKELDEVLERLDSLQPGSLRRAGKSLEELFEARDGTKPGSMEERAAAEKILEAVFPDTNAG
jgi:DNA-directed RNA polymerase subunit F